MMKNHNTGILYDHLSFSICNGDLMMIVRRTWGLMTSKRTLVCSAVLIPSFPMTSSSFPLICSHSKCRTMTAPPSPLLTDESSPLKGRRQSYQDTFFGYENLPPSQILILIQFSITYNGQKGRDRLVKNARMIVMEV